MDYRQRIRQILSSSLSTTQRIVLVVLSHHSNDEGCSRPSQRLIAAETGCSVRTVRRAVNGLRASGILSATPDPLASSGALEYRLHFDKLPKRPLSLREQRELRETLEREAR